MREILFRGQTRRYGEKVRMGDGEKLPSRWVYGGVLQGAGAHSIIYGGENMNDPGEGLDKWPVYTDTLGQYTGLTDKNGKRVFEWDVVKGQNALHEREELYTVKYEGCGLYFFDDCDTPWNCEHITDMAVIGNIHDNPELLKEGRQWLSISRGK